MHRRRFLELSLMAGGTLAARRLGASEQLPTSTEFVGVLCDTTRCIGCGACERACARSNGLPVPPPPGNAPGSPRTTTDTQFTVVNRYQTSRGQVHVKKQCMHCWQPACAAACLTKAMFKTEVGPVIWREDKCMGCRYCMVSCPFGMPRYEYGSNNPRVRKCTMCWDRISAGKKPACVEACPTDTLMFGMKRDLMEVARTRVYRHPHAYHPQVYGEHEAGGSSWLYLAAVPFEELGFPTNLGTTPFPAFTTELLYAVPIISFGVPAFLLALNALTGDRNRKPGSGGEGHE
jgi:Fe-S-cluster-containing dehydrogenase component